MYEAKFEKFLNSKVSRNFIDSKQVEIIEDFDLYTKGPSSPSRLKKRFKIEEDPIKDLYEPIGLSKEFLEI
jgi:hypothetical protein